MFSVLLGVCLVFLFSVMGCGRDRPKTEGPPASGKDRNGPTSTVPSIPAAEGVLSSTTLLATIDAGEKVVVAGSHGAPEGFSGLLFSEQGKGVAYIAEKDDLFRVVHNGGRGKLYKHIEGLVISPDGSRTAYVAAVGEKWCIAADGKEGRLFDGVGTPRFSPDSRHILYNAADRGQGHLVVDGTVSASFPSSWDELFSGDSKKVISIQNSADHDTVHRVVIYDLSLKKLWEKELNAILFVFNKARNRIAAIGLVNGMQQLVEFSLDNPDTVNKGQVYKEIHGHSFGPDGVSVAYAADKGEKLAVVLNGKEEMLPDGARADQPVVRPDGKAAGIILADKGGFSFHQAFVSGGRKPKKYQEAGQPVYSSDGKGYAYIARQDQRFFVVVSGKEGPVFDMVVTPMFSPDGKYLVYRARNDGKRFVVVADAIGKTVSQHPAYEQVFQPVFTDDGKSVAYGVKDGNKLVWKVEKLEK